MDYSELEYGKAYLLWRDGEYIGTAVWTQDPNIGDNFIEEIEIDGEIINHVYFADSWAEKKDQ
jgi:hypothetical protein